MPGTARLRGRLDTLRTRLETAPPPGRRWAPFIDTLASIIVIAPVAMHFGIDPVHFGLVMVVNLALGMITPPFGVNLFAACTVARVAVDEIVPRLLPFVAVVLGCLAIVTYFPLVTLGLRDLVYR